MCVWWLAKLCSSEEGAGDLNWERYSQDRVRADKNGHTEMKVAGRKIMVNSAIDFMTLLSCLAMLL